MCIRDSPSFVGNEDIPFSPDRLDDLRLGGVLFDLAPNPGDAHVDAPVSYTHLDVYKRQQLSGYRRTAVAVETLKRNKRYLTNA